MTPLQTIAMGLVHRRWCRRTSPATRTPSGASTTPCPTRSAGCWCSPASARAAAGQRPRPRRGCAGWPRWSRSSSACRCGSRRSSHLLVPEHNPDITVSFQWFVALPQTLFSLFLVRAVGRAAIDAASPRDVFVAGRFGVLTWGLAALLVLPVVAYGGGVDALVDPDAAADRAGEHRGHLLPVPRAPPDVAGRPGPLEVHPVSAPRTDRRRARVPPERTSRPSRSAATSLREAAATRDRGSARSRARLRRGRR